MKRDNGKRAGNNKSSRSKDIESAQSQDLVDSKQQQQQLLLLTSNNEASSEKTILAQQELADSDDQRLHNNSNNNNNNSTRTTTTNSSSKKHQTIAAAMSAFCFKGRWLVLVSMTTALIITAILVAMLTISLLNDEDQCFNSFPFQQPSYKLFSTKTAYATTYNLLNNSQPAPSGLSIASLNGNGNGGGGPQYDYLNKLELPNIFSKSESLRSLNQRLTSSKEFGCKVKQLHYFGRHAARFPSSEDIEFINKHLQNVQNRIDLSKFSLNNQPQQQQQTTTSNKSNNNSSSVCFNPLAQYKQWASFMTPEQGNLIMESGLEETQAIAQRFRSIYPEMFEASAAKIEVGTTDELRTAQTALVFLKQISNFKLGVCDDDFQSFESYSSLPTSSPQSSSSSSKETAGEDESVGGRLRFSVPDAKSSQCYKKLINKYQLEKLQFHKKCQSLHKEQRPLPYNLNLKEPNRTRFITSSVSKKLKLAKEDSLSSDETQAIYKICRYESALVGSSIWCNLFADSELKFYEYLEDIDDFFNQAYGHPDQYRSACPVTTDLMKAFKRAQQAPEAHFYFTHSQVIQKLLAASVDLETDADYELKNIQRNLQEASTPEARQWRTSLYSPFSANLAFTLYECPRSGKELDNAGPGYQYFDVTDSPFKVVASLNEKPIQLDGCSQLICDLTELLKDSRIDREKRCKMDDICKVNRVFT